MIANYYWDIIFYFFFLLTIGGIMFFCVYYLLRKAISDPLNATLEKQNKKLDELIQLLKDKA